MLKQQKIFFDFLRFCIGSAKEIPGSLKEVDWKELYAIAQKQALLGVLFQGIQRLPKELAPEQKLLMQWMVMAEMIRKQNIRLFQDSVKVCKNFENKGFAKRILKGQGMRCFILTLICERLEISISIFRVVAGKS